MKRNSNYNPLFPNITELSWKNIFYYKHKLWESIEKCHKAAKEADYPYFCWNDRIYHTESGVLTPVVYNYEADQYNQFYYDYDLIRGSYCGKKVTKISGKPFKSTFKTNTVKDVIRSYRPNDKTDIPAFKFEEDESFVHCYLTETVKQS